mgnify:FL=1
MSQLQPENSQILIVDDLADDRDILSRKSTMVLASTLVAKNLANKQ